MGIKELIEREAEASERNPDAPLKPGTRVTRGHGRTRTLQVRLTDAEYEELEREADAAGLPVSTLARQKLLDAGQSRSGPSAEEIAEAVHERITRQPVSTVRERADMYPDGVYESQADKHAAGIWDNLTGESVENN